MVFDMEKRMAPKKQAVQKRSVKMPPKPVKASAKAKPPGAKVAKSQEIEKAKTALKKESKSIAVKETVKAKGKAIEAAAQTSAAEQNVEQKPAKRGRKISIEISANEAASALAAKWATLNKKSEQIDVKPYNMKGVFEEKTAITHKVLGWGYILANRNDRLEVLFKDGIKYLISNYKPA